MQYDTGMKDVDPNKPKQGPAVDEDMPPITEWVFDGAMALWALVAVLGLSAALAYVQFVQRRAVPPAAWGLIAGFAGLGFLYFLILNVYRRYWP